MPENLKKRLKNKYFWLAAAGFAYQILNRYGYAPELGTWQAGIDLISYLAIGSGIYSTFEG
ncbi:hypothetical protein DCMF_27240 [Candidatus Formimonas warabiya]|uniref:Uncharacterized protein n=2 Tax=Formimonas warabiya TaxID=1761012 RepID=A0A3G1KZY5_FORW1|nr:hypothetical protein DCMF_27240 [Candidatus Formimonas warabiya]